MVSMLSICVLCGCLLCDVWCPCFLSVCCVGAFCVMYGVHAFYLCVVWVPFVWSLVLVGGQLNEKYDL